MITTFQLKIHLTWIDLSIRDAVYSHTEPGTYECIVNFDIQSIHSLIGKTLAIRMCDRERASAKHLTISGDAMLWLNADG